MRRFIGALVFLLLLFLIFPATASAATYYVDATSGLDSNTGTATDQAWQTIARVNASSFSPGDNIYFKRGEIWRERLIPPSSGTSGNNITFGAYDSGDKPIISGGTLIPSGSTWMDSGVNGEYYRLLGTTGDLVSSDILVVRAQPTGISTYVRMVLGTKGSLGEDQYSIFLSSGNRYLYYKPLSGHTPSEYDFEWTSRNTAISLSVNYNVVENIEAIMGYILYKVDQSQGTINITGSNNTIRNCNVYFSKTYGIYIHGANNVIDSCTSSYNRATGIYFGTNGDSSSVLNSTSTYNGTLSSDAVNDRGGIGVNADGVTITGNTIGNNGVTTGLLTYVNSEIQIAVANSGTISRNYIYNAARNAIGMDDSATTYGWNIQYNLINRWGLTQEGGTKNNIAIKLVGHGNTSTSGVHRVENNAIYSDDDYVLIGINLGMSTSSDYIKDSSIKNNLVFLENNTSASSYAIRVNRNNITGTQLDYNLAFGPTNIYQFAGTNYANASTFYSATGQGQHDSSDIGAYGFP